MSVEAKIKELLNRTSTAQNLNEEQEDLAAAGMAGTGSKAASKMSKDTSKSAKVATAGDTTQPKQGSSQTASFTTHDEDDENQGAKAAAPVSKDNTLPKSKGDAKTVKVPAMEETEEEGEVVAEEQHREDIASQIKSIFGDDLSEEFTSKAASIFEAAVIARVNNEMEKVAARLEEQAQTQLDEFKQGLVEKVDGYLNYVVEQWMEENQLAVEQGLRTEVAEDFISGLKTLFQEHYIEVPEEKYDVMKELEQTTESLQTKLDESVATAIELSKELEQLKREKVLEEQTKDLADTEVEKLRKLVEGVNFDSEDLYREKVGVIIENYFPKTTAKSPEQVLIEESGTQPTFANDDDQMERYAMSISRSLKAR